MLSGGLGAPVGLCLSALGFEKRSTGGSSRKHADELRPTLAKALAADRPTLLHIKVPA